MFQLIRPTRKILARKSTNKWNTGWIPLVYRFLRTYYNSLSLTLGFWPLDSINPITGSYEPERPNPLDQMSDEQKEYEAVKLVNMIDQLQRYEREICLKTVYFAHVQLTD